jgi:type II secretory pathway pseudopilin PulG
MMLRGQQRGYAMVVLLISLSIMAIMMTVVMPVWRQMAQREKEAELVFRGEQYARAINLLQRKSVGALPPSIDFLIEQRFLRKKFKDPITNDDFAPVLLAAAAPQGGAPATQPGGAPGGSPAAGRGAQAGATPPTGTTGSGTPGPPAAAGITGVTSKSKDTSIRLYKGRNHYNEWLFVFTPPAAAPGGGPPGTGGPRGGGPRGGGPQGPGNPQIPPPFGNPGGPRGNPSSPILPTGPGNPTGPGRGGPPPPPRL